MIVSLVLLICTICASAAPLTAYSFGIDIYDPEEDVSINSFIQVDATAGAALIQASTADGVSALAHVHALLA